MKNQSNKTGKLRETIKFWLIELPIMLVAIIGLIVFISSRDAEAKLLAERSMAYVGLPLILISYLIDLVGALREKVRKHREV